MFTLLLFPIFCFSVCTNAAGEATADRFAKITFDFFSPSSPLASVTFLLLLLFVWRVIFLWSSLLDDFLDLTSNCCSPICFKGHPHPDVSVHFDGGLPPRKPLQWLDNIHVGRSSAHEWQFVSVLTFGRQNTHTPRAHHEGRKETLAEM